MCAARVMSCTQIQIRGKKIQRQVRRHTRLKLKRAEPKTRASFLCPESELELGLGLVFGYAGSERVFVTNSSQLEVYPVYSFISIKIDKYRTVSAINLYLMNLNMKYKCIVRYLSIERQQQY